MYDEKMFFHAFKSSHTTQLRLSKSKRGKKVKYRYIYRGARMKVLSCVHTVYVSFKVFHLLPRTPHITTKKKATNNIFKKSSTL